MKQREATVTNFDTKFEFASSKAIKLMFNEATSFFAFFLTLNTLLTQKITNTLFIK